MLVDRPAEVSAPEPEQIVSNAPEPSSQTKKQQAPESMLPKAPAPGYSTIPSFVQLARMDLDEIEEIFEFTVKNEHGEIKFIAPPG